MNENPAYFALAGYYLYKSKDIFSNNLAKFNLLVIYKYTYSKLKIPMNVTFLSNLNFVFGLQVVFIK